MRVRQEEPSPPRPEAYPIPTQTYPREYFTFPASKSQDRVGPGQPWQSNEAEPLPPMDNHTNNSMSMQVSLRLNVRKSAFSFNSYFACLLYPNNINVILILCD